MGLALASAAMSGSACAQGFLSEIQGGVLAHDVPILGEQSEHGADINGEVRFVSPVPNSWVADTPLGLRWMLTPRPHVGFEVNTSGDTSQVYLGLTWTAVLFRGVARPNDRIDFSIGFGPAFNNGHRHESSGHLGLGSNVLFHPYVELGLLGRPALERGAVFRPQLECRPGGGERGAGQFRRARRVGVLIPARDMADAWLRLSLRVGHRRSRPATG